MIHDHYDVIMQQACISQGGTDKITCRYFLLTLLFFFNGVCIVKRKGAVESNGGVYRTVLGFYVKCKSYTCINCAAPRCAPAFSWLLGRM